MLNETFSVIFKQRASLGTVKYNCMTTAKIADVLLFFHFIFLLLHPSNYSVIISLCRFSSLASGFRCFNGGSAAGKERKLLHTHIRIRYYTYSLLPEEERVLLLRFFPYSKVHLSIIVAFPPFQKCWKRRITSTTRRQG